MCAVGTKVNSERYPANWIDSNCRLKVRSTFQLDEFYNIFALGDVCNTKEPKQAYIVKLHVPIVADNVKRLIRNASLTSYSPPMVSLMVVPVGMNDGITSISIMSMNFTLGSWFTKLRKVNLCFLSGVGRRIT